MKIFLALLLCALPAIVADQASLETFSGADGAFQFQYPALLVRCTRKNPGRRDSGSWTPASSCAAYTPVCDDPGIPGARTLACFAYPKAKFKDAPAFNAAAFAVSQIQSATTEKECLAGSPGWLASPGAGKILSIHGAAFRVFHVSDAGMSHFLGRMYRAFHRNICYQLSIRIATTNPGVFPQPIHQFTKKDREGVNRSLIQARDSFQFLK